MVSARRYLREPSLLESLRAGYVKLLWTTVANVVQSYHIIKALALLRFWPLPENNTFKDPTSQLSGTMMQFAMQNFLQYPSHMKTEQRDRLLTWIACNIVCQRYDLFHLLSSHLIIYSTSSVYGLPPVTLYTGILGSNFRHLEPFDLPQDLVHQLKISHFCNELTQTFYCNDSDPNCMLPMGDRPLAMDKLSAKYADLSRALGAEISGKNTCLLLDHLP